MYIYNVMEKLINFTSNSKDVPIGACVIKDGNIISMKTNDSQNAIFHAEILAIIDACNKLNSKDLRECEMVVTLEPCPMCMSAIILSKIKRLYFGARDFRMGAAESVIKLQKEIILNHNVEVIGGIMEYECKNLLLEFFKQKRVNS